MRRMNTPPFSDFRSDTVTRPTPAMREAMHRAELGDDVFGDDPSVNRLQACAAERLGFEAALFAPSGTQANLIGLMAHCERGDEAIVGQRWHTYRWEAGGMAVLGGIQPQPIEHRADGSLDPAAIEAAIKPDDPHFARTRLVVLENTTGGRVLPLAYLGEVQALTCRRGLGLHLDGARLFNAAAALDAADPWQAARAVCRHFDSASVCLSKGLGAPVGSLLLGSAAFIAKARRLRKLLGGGMRQAGVLAAAGLHALDHHVQRLPEDHALAISLHAALADAIGGHAALRNAVHLEAPSTNMLFMTVDDPVAGPLLAALKAAGIGVTANTGPAGVQVRWVTHLDVGPRDVARAAEALGSFRA